MGITVCVEEHVGASETVIERWDCKHEENEWKRGTYEEVNTERVWLETRQERLPRLMDHTCLHF